MSGARKLQTEIDRVMKKVDEGVDLFDEIWEKVYSAEQQNQKEKHEVDLKKEIKKLQRLRDQIKSWIGSSEVKDKDALIDARRLIETKMEQFKICEKETKTKTYSKEGLARAEKLSPEEEAKKKTIEWMKEVIEKLNQLVEDRDVEIERLSAGKGKKSNRHVIEEYNQYITNHRFHISKLEGIMRLVNNDRLEVETVDEIKEDLEYYLEAYEDDDYMQSYDEDMFYETLGLDDLDVVNVDRVTQASSHEEKKGRKGRGSSGDNDDDASSEHSRGGSRGGGRASKKSSSSSGGMIPLTIGRATKKSSKDSGDAKEKSATPTKGGRQVSDSGSVGSAGVLPRDRSGGSVSSATHQIPGSGVPPTLVPAVPAVHKVAPAPPGGASMAAILKREGEAQQEKERQQKAALQAQQQQQQAAAAQAAQQQQLLREQQQRQQQQLAAQQQEERLRQQKAQAAAQQQQQQQQALRQQEALRQQQQQAAQAQQEALKRQQEQQARETAAKQQQQQQLKQQQAAQAQDPLSQQQHQQQQGSAVDNLLTSGLGGLSLGLGSSEASNSPNNNNAASSSPAAVSPQQGPHGAGQGGHPVLGVSFGASDAASSSYLGALNDSFLHCPTPADGGGPASGGATGGDGSARGGGPGAASRRNYAPRNPYPTPPSYPSAPSPLFDNPAIFEKLGTDCLFFIFYYAQGTYQQYLAARELKKQSWRYHKKYMTWFQRHEEPKVTTDEYEQGTYVYFDYETGWCQRIKSDFRFEYSFLEDSLII